MTARTVEVIPQPVFSVLAPRIARCGAANIASGMPDWPVPTLVLKHSLEAFTSGSLQYTQPGGDPTLKQEIRLLYEPLLGRSLSAEKEVLVTMGAGHAILLAIKACCQPGDNVVVFEPFFSFYSNQASAAGVALAPVALDENTHSLSSTERWQLNENSLRLAIGPRSKAILLNSPHNPTGKVFTRAELAVVAKVALDFDLVVISDEVYEFLVFEGFHVRIATLPGMWERTITCSAASKTFSVTGYRLGWMLGPEWAVQRCSNLCTADVYCVPTPLQRALAACIRTVREHQLVFLETERQKMAAQCQKLLGVLRDVFGREHVIQPQGGYFIVVTIAHIPRSLYADATMPDDMAFTMWLIEKVGVACFPMAEFYARKGSPLSVRFCFAKMDQTLTLAAERLGKCKL